MEDFIMAVEHIAEIVLGSSATGINFTSIPSTYRDLSMTAHYTGTSGSLLQATMLFNGYTGTLHAYGARVSSSAGIQSGSGSGNTNILLSGLNLVSNIDATPSVATFDFLDYARAGIGRHVITRMDTPQQSFVMSQGFWNVTDPINAINLFLTSGSFAAGSRFTLWGVTA
jgi:hypothetical protein